MTNGQITLVKINVNDIPSTMMKRGSKWDDAINQALALQPGEALEIKSGSNISGLYSEVKGRKMSNLVRVLRRGSRWFIVRINA
jgi:hypothetical protein